MTHATRIRNHEPTPGQHLNEIPIVEGRRDNDPALPRADFLGRPADVGIGMDGKYQTDIAVVPNEAAKNLKIVRQDLTKRFAPMRGRRSTICSASTTGLPVRKMLASEMPSETSISRLRRVAAK